MGLFLRPKAVRISNNSHYIQANRHPSHTVCSRYEPQNGKCVLSLCLQDRHKWGAGGYHTISLLTRYSHTAPTFQSLKACATSQAHNIWIVWMEKVWVKSVSWIILPIIVREQLSVWAVSALMTPLFTFLTEFGDDDSFYLWLPLTFRWVSLYMM